MSKRHWFAGVAIGLAGGAVLFQAIEPSIPRLKNLPHGTLAAPECGYDEAVRTESEAERNAQSAEKAPERSLGTSEGGGANQPPESGKDKAKECEERARAWSDLQAQWQSARASSVTADLTRVQVIGTGLEILVLAAALTAAIWAAWETRKANRIADRTSIAELRPYVFVVGVRREKMKDASGAPCVKLQIGLKNLGRTPATITWMRIIQIVTDERKEPSLPEVGFDQKHATRVLMAPETSFFASAADRHAYLNVGALNELIAKDRRLFFLTAVRYQGPIEPGRTYETIMLAEITMDAKDALAAWNTEAPVETWLGFASKADGASYT